MSITNPAPEQITDNQFIPSEMVELALNAFGLDWTFEIVDVDDIDFEASQKNQVRDKAVDKEVAGRYADALVAGDIFPAGVVMRRPRKTPPLLIVDFNHRGVAAVACGMKKVEAYVIGPIDPDTFLALGYRLNLHGLPFTETEKLERATDMVATGYATVRQAALALGVRDHQVTARLRLRRVDERVEGLRAYVSKVRFNHLSETVRERLGSIKSDKVFIAATNLSIGRNLNTSQIQRLIKTVNHAKSEADALDYIKKWTPAKPGEQRKSKETQFTDQWARAIAVACNIAGVDEAELARSAAEHTAADRRRAVSEFRRAAACFTLYAERLEGIEGGDA